MKYLSAVVALGALLLAAQPAGAASIVNGDFEQGPYGPSDPPFSFVTLGSGDTSINGWTVGGAGVDYIGDYWYDHTLGVGENGHSIDMSALSAGSLTQQLTGLVVSQTYRVSFWMSGNPEGGAGSRSLQVAATGNPSSGTLSVIVAAAAGPHPYTLNWTQFYYDFTATASSAALTFTSLENNPFGPALDDVSISAVPIPAALPLFASGLAAFGVFARRRRKAAAVQA